jgi:hypothetical protein
MGLAKKNNKKIIHQIENIGKLKMRNNYSEEDNSYIRHINECIEVSQLLIESLKQNHKEL